MKGIKLFDARHSLLRRSDQAQRFFNETKTSEGEVLSASG